MLELQYRIKDLEFGDKDVNLALSSEQISDAVGDLDVELSQSAIELTTQLRMQGQVVQLDGTMHGQLTLPCQRCLEPARIPVEMRLHTVYTPAPAEERQSDDAAVDDEDVDYAHHDGETVDLWPLLREDLILAVPMQVLCKEDCRGLCPSCGTDLNTKTCACKPVGSLSPLAGLRSIKLPT